MNLQFSIAIKEISIHSVIFKGNEERIDENEVTIINQGDGSPIISLSRGR